jgi:hypothetical protein
MRNTIVFRNYTQGRELPPSEVPQAGLVRQLKAQLDKLDFDYTCTVQLDDNRTDTVDATQVWVTRSVNGKWSHIHKLSIPFSAFQAEHLDRSITTLVAQFLESVKESGHR